MKNNTERKYNCKHEELPVIAGYAVSNLKRDFDDFTAFSPKFDPTYVKDFQNRIANVQEVVNPVLETQKLKQVTERLYETMDSLIPPADYLGGYLNLAKNEIALSMKDFGITSLKLNIRRRDAEGVIENLKLVNANIEKHKAALTEAGLSEETIKLFADSVISIQDDNQRQYEIVSGRKKIVEQNVELLNELYTQIMDISEIGKMLYGKTDKLKAGEYMFTNLLKSVRNVPKTTKAG